MTGSERESIILCEGFHDRAFWKGWLTHLGCRDARIRRSDGTFDSPVDPFGKPVPRGQFAFRSPRGQFIRLQECKGEKNVRKAARARLEQHKTQALHHLIVNIDLDTAAGDSEAMHTARQKLRDWLEGLMSPELRDDGVVAAPVDWSAYDPPSPELPPKQTLERLVCAALREVWPGRARAVAEWLAHRPDPPARDPKEFAWSHMAGWYATDGCDEFYQGIWRDGEVALALTERLRCTGATEAVQALLDPGSGLS